METKLTSRDIIEAYHRIGEIMDLAGAPDIDAAALDASTPKPSTCSTRSGQRHPRSWRRSAQSAPTCPARPTCSASRSAG